jgi:uncharacterized membrane protein YfcA
LPGVVQLFAFALIMLIAAWRMFRGDVEAASASTSPASRVARSRLVRTGLVVGFTTGTVGVGGGFLVVPALVLLAGLSMRRAVGTSLLVISTNAFSGFGKQLGTLKVLNLALDWHVITMFVAIGGAGTLAGNFIGRTLPQQRLRQGFAFLLVGMAVYIVVRESPSLLALARTLS